MQHHNHNHNHISMTSSDILLDIVRMLDLAVLRRNLIEQNSFVNRHILLSEC